MSRAFRLVVIDCKRAEKGFRHAVYESGHLNGKPYVNTISVDYISQVLNEPEWVNSYRLNPEQFCKEAANG